MISLDPTAQLDVAMRVLSHWICILSLGRVVLILLEWINECSLSRANFTKTNAMRLEP